jgi:hypothetical protein
MHREWVCILLVVGLMTVFGVGAATIALLDPTPAIETVVMSLAGGIVLGAVVGLAIMFSQTQVFGPSLVRAYAPNPLPQSPALPETSGVTAALPAPTPAPKPRPEEQPVAAAS